MTKLTIAIDLYDRHLPLFMGQVATPEELQIDFLEVGMAPPRRHGIDRHRRMLIDGEFDAAEVSLASYLVARNQGRDDIVALPIFPRRLFSHNHIFVAEESGIEHPNDLSGKKVIVWAFQVTMSVLAKGDLGRSYDVPWQSIRWLTQHPEEVNADYGGEAQIELLGTNSDPAKLLRIGAADAYINPHPPERMMTVGSGIRRLSRDPDALSREYIARFGYFPIMHLLAVKRSVLESRPNLGSELVRMFDTARKLSREYYVDPGFSLITQCRNTLEWQEEFLGHDLWPSGLSANRQNLDDFINFCLDQRLIDSPVVPEDLFHPAALSETTV